VDSRPASLTASLKQAGFTTLQFVVAAGLALVVFVTVANLVVVQYGQGAVRSSLEEGVRAGSRVGAGEEDCLVAAQESLRSLLGGSMGTSVVLSCALGNGLIVATAEGSLPGWLPGIADFVVDAEALAVKETA